MTDRMFACASRITSAVGLVLFASACEYDRDTVALGFYGSTSAGTSATSNTRPPAAALRSQQQSSAGMLAQATAGAAGAASGSGSALSMTLTSSGAGTGSLQPSASDANNCDLSGRWLSTLHTVTDALGNLQYSHSYIYYEITQQADSFTITKGLACGDDAAGGGSLAVEVDFRASWAAAMSKVSFTGRKGTSVPAANGCQIDLDPWYEVKGASVPHYLDPNIALPTADQAASGSMPGWEDWDNDGHPGITGTLTGAIAGKIFTAPRKWTSASGVANIKTTFTLPLSWDVEPNVMSYDGTPLLASEAARASDSKLHFVQFARVSATQAPMTDDAQICKSIVELAPILTPEASGK